MLDRRFYALLLTIFLTVSSVAWAISFGVMYGPPSDPAKICALHDTARQSAFCVELAKAKGRQKPQEAK